MLFSVRTERVTLLDGTRGAPLDYDGGGDWREWLTGWLEAETRLSEVRADEKSLTWSYLRYVFFSHLSLSLTHSLFSLSLPLSFSLLRLSYRKLRGSGTLGFN